MDAGKLSSSSSSSSSSSFSLAPPPTNPVSNRHRVLLELLKSERAYASDLALIRDVHIPLALGGPAAFHRTPPASNSLYSLSRTLSTSFNSSSSSRLDPAMTREDTEIIFGNISELALFADMFAERLEDALGAVLEGGVGEDRVGRLFLETVSSLEPSYTTYITRYPSALARLQGLPQTSALSAYLARTQTPISSLTDAWDLPSLLIKPVQRLLKYPLLLAAIIDETPDIHPDKENLKKARESMDVFAGTFNEENRRFKAEVVMEVLERAKKFGEVSPDPQKLRTNHHLFLDPKGNQLFAGAGSMPPFQVRARKPPLQDPNPKLSVPVGRHINRATGDGEVYGALDRTTVDVTDVTEDDEQVGCRGQGYPESTKTYHFTWFNSVSVVVSILITGAGIPVGEPNEASTSATIQKCGKSSSPQSGQCYCAMEGARFKPNVILLPPDDFPIRVSRAGGITVTRISWARLGLEG